jgi:two-component system, OmpR family, phosphate regulon sensor histidine kinase PhoR
MFFRFFTFIACQLVGAFIAWYLVRPLNSASTEMLMLPLGVFLGALTWFAMDLTRCLRLLRWLRAGDASDVAMRTGLWGEVSDRTRRLIRIREQATRESQNRLEDFLSALQASPNGVVMLDSDGRIEWFNQIAADHFGFDAMRDMFQHFGNLVRDPGVASYFAHHDYSSEIVMPGRESSPARPVKLSVHLHRYGEGKLLLLSRDVTILEQAEAMRRDFVANVSHEIRTPLTVLGGFVETLQTLQLNDQEKERYLALMAQQADRMQTLVTDLLILSRLEGSPPPSLSDWISMPELMSHVEQDAHALSSVLNLSEEQSHSLIFESLFTGEIAGSTSEIMSAMSNLVGNAVRYTPLGGKIHVKAVQLPDLRVAFSVADTGSGISPEHIPRLTERFYRVDRSRSRETGGTGLGLAIVKHVTQRHGSELKIESQLNKGSVFTVIFPAIRIRSV